ncbi:hydrogenase [Tepiditoga spiralis]|uniref:Hydrogenase n=1 Tax=Tepiditoga spiralis TaxID=2108365 RepID=A0A7G1GB29_9BACT|nr:proton-conducting transporter membrane subunit [Tepiditoga spiralis]BBE31512.1 hydrogenase [Tepiditoga spiralis]
MDIFFMSIFLILIGGTLPLFLTKKFNVMKFFSIGLISFGTIISLIESIFLLVKFNGNINFSYLKLPYFPIEFQINELSLFFISIISLIGFLSIIYSFSYLNNEKKSKNIAINYFFYSLLVISMMTVVLSNNLITFAFNWEIMSLSSFFLVIFEYNKEKVRRAGHMYFIFTHIGGMFIFASFGLIYAYTNSFSFDGISSLPENIKLIAFILSLIGFGSKAGLIPIHIWLPHAHPIAPSHVSAIMSGVMIKIGIYGILKMYLLLNTSITLIPYIVISIGVISGILGVVYALGQHNLKKLLAYHSVENIGIITMGIGVGMLGVTIKNPIITLLGFSGGLLHILNHSIFKSLLFLGAGSILHQTGIESIEEMGGFLKKMKVTSITFLIGSLAIAGLPPFNGFVSEFLIYFGVFNGMNLSNFPYVFSLIVILSLVMIGGLAIMCFTKVIGVVFLGTPKTNKAKNAKESNYFILIPMIILTIFCIFIGIFPSVFINNVFNIVNSFKLTQKVNIDLKIASNITFSSTLFIISLLIIYLIRKYFYKNKKIKNSTTWDCGYGYPTSKMQYTGSSYAHEILNFYKPFIKVEESIDEIKGIFPKGTMYESKTIDVSEYLIKKYIVNPILFISNKLRWIQHGDVHGYIAYIFIALTLFLIMGVIK